MMPPRRRAVMPVHDGKHKYLNAGEFDQTYSNLERAILTPEFRSHAEIFVESFNRIGALHDLPVQLIAWADHVATCRLMARMNLGLTVDDASKDGNQEFNEAFWPLFTTRGRSPADSRGYGG